MTHHHTSSTPTRSRLLVEGMRENSCREAVAEALASIPGVREVEVSLFHASATVIHTPEASVAAMIGAVERAGYPAAPLGSGKGAA